MAVRRALAGAYRSNLHPISADEALIGLNADVDLVETLNRFSRGKDLHAGARSVGHDVTPVSHPAGTGIRRSSDAPSGRPSSSLSSAQRCGYTFLIESELGRLKLRGADGPVFTSPRLGAAIQFLWDTHLIGPEGLTDHGAQIAVGA
jgi:hypothetical protein